MILEGILDKDYVYKVYLQCISSYDWHAYLKSLYKKK